MGSRQDAVDGRWSVVDRGKGEQIYRIDLCAKVKMELPAFKLNVPKLKALGLTESLEIGYRLSARGRAWLARHA